MPITKPVQTPIAPHLKHLVGNYSCEDLALILQYEISRYGVGVTIPKDLVDPLIESLQSVAE